MTRSDIIRRIAFRLTQGDRLEAHDLKLAEEIYNIAHGHIVIEDDSRQVALENWRKEHVRALRR